MRSRGVAGMTSHVWPADGGAMKVPGATLDALLECWPVARLATLTPAAAPHVLPVVFVVEGDCVYSPVDGKRKDTARLARVRNVESHGRASLLLDDYSDDWNQLWWVRLDGPAWVERDDADLLERTAAALHRKYPQYRQVATYAGAPTLLVVRRQRLAAWSQTGDDGPIRQAVQALQSGGATRQ